MLAYAVDGLPALIDERPRLCVSERAQLAELQLEHDEQLGCRIVQLARNAPTLVPPRVALVRARFVTVIGIVVRRQKKDPPTTFVASAV